MCPFTPQEARTFLAAIHGERLEALYAIALALGLRQGEVLGLTWGDVDFVAGIIHVRQQLQRIGGQLRRCDLKTAQSRRTLLLPPSLRTLLIVHRERQRAEREAAGAAWRDPIADLVFTTTVGTPLQSRPLANQFHALLDRVGLRRQRFHDLRHCCATLLLAQGVSLRVIMETLGHNQIGVTMNTYAHVIPALAQEATAHMESFLQSAP